METLVFDKLKGKGLADEKITITDHNGVQKEVSLLDYVIDLDEGVTKTRAANKDLTIQREAWEKQEKTYKQKETELTTKAEALEKEKNELSGKGNKKGQELEEVTRQLNAVNDKLTQLEALRVAAEAKAVEAEKRAKTNASRSAEDALKADIITELGKHKISGAQAEAAFAVIKTKGNAKIEEDAATGTYKRIFVNIKDGKELAADIKNMCENFAQENKFFVSASGMPGTGTNHESNKPAGGNTKDPSTVDMLRMKDSK